jgi:hypothetical protein
MQIESNPVVTNTRATEPVPARPAPRPELVVAQNLPAKTTDTADTTSRRVAANRHFDIHEDPVTKEIVVKVVDAVTGRVIRQIPSEEMLRMAQAIAQQFASQSVRRSSKAGG